jgi:hypothetical protein
MVILVALAKTEDFLSFYNILIVYIGPFYLTSSNICYKIEKISCFIKEFLHFQIELLFLYRLLQD